MKAIKQILAFTGLAASLFSMSAQSIIISSDRTAFESAIAIAATDDFEDLGVSAGNVLSLGDPITRGDFTFASSSGFGTVGLGSGFGGLTSVGMAPSFFADTLTIELVGGHNAFGFDVTSDGSPVLSISIFDVLDNFLGFTSMAFNSSSLSFVGIYSDVAIGSVFLDDGEVNFGGPLVDNLVAGNLAVGNAAVPIPTTIFLLGLGLAGLGWSNRKRG